MRAVLRRLQYFQRVTRVATTAVSNHPVQPGSDIAPARNCGEIINRGQKTKIRQLLQNAQIQCGAADAAAGEAYPEGRWRRLIALIQPEYSSALLDLLLLGLSHIPGADDGGCVW